ncbi:MAG TPA: sugar ABC transporter permease [Candidatus Dormibacteraeota bacterium]|nr:sugar ABC transporter permease [Candidatus Dormibacteraeota bacterium]
MGDALAASGLEVGILVLAITVVVTAIEFAAYLVLVKLLKSRHALAFMLLLPGIAAVTAFVVFPIGWDFVLSFTNMNLYHIDNYTFVGFRNYVNVFQGAILHKYGFWEIFLRTIAWTAINVSISVTLGLCLALLLNRKMRLGPFYRALLIIPWALPQVIAVLAIRGADFDEEFGLFNVVFRTMHLGPYPWRTDGNWLFASAIITNIWLGIPFMMFILLGALQSINAEYYEAADMDGATWWQQFRGITWPMIQPVMTPAVVLSVIWTFNNVNVIYLMSNSQIPEEAQILVTAIYSAGFQFYRYAFGAAFAVVTFLILFGFAAVYIRVNRASQALYE